MKRRSLIISLLLIFVAAGTFLTTQALRPSKSAAEKAARTILGMFRNSELYDAYRETTVQIRSKNFEAFEKKVSDTGLVGWKSLDLNKGEWMANEVIFHGNAITATDTKTELSIALIKESGGWKLSSVKSDYLGNKLTDDASSSPERIHNKIPDTDTLQNMVYTTMMQFNDAVKAKFFGSFYQQISVKWQKQTTPTKLDEAFRAFMDKEVTFDNLQKETIVFTPDPEMDVNNLLHLQGHYPNGDFSVVFDLKYIKEYNLWQLFGINISLLPSKQNVPEKSE